jgi:hypothetical protein
MPEKDTEMCIVTEIGTFGSMSIPDPTATPVSELYNTTKDESLKKYLKENMMNTDGGKD